MEKAKTWKKDAGIFCINGSNKAKTITSIKYKRFMGYIAKSIMYDFEWGFVEIFPRFYSFNLLPVNLSIFLFSCFGAILFDFVCIWIVFNGMMMSFGVTFKPVIWKSRFIHHLTIICVAQLNTLFTTCTKFNWILQWETF